MRKLIPTERQGRVAVAVMEKSLLPGNHEGLA
jgi:hypothetical protein